MSSARERKLASAAKRAATLQANRQHAREAARNMSRERHLAYVRAQMDLLDHQAAADMERSEWRYYVGLPMERRLREAMVPQLVASELTRFECRRGGRVCISLTKRHLLMSDVRTTAALEACGATEVEWVQTKQPYAGSTAPMLELHLLWPASPE